MVKRINPFNPQQPAKPHFFVGREEEIDCFETYLHQTINGSPMNMSITGDRGMGKTSLLNKFDDIARDKGCLVIRLSNYEGNVEKIVELSEYIIASIQREIVSRNNFTKVKNKFTQWLYSFKPTMEVEGVSFSIEKKSIINEVFRDKLQEIWENVKDKFSAIIILIDEAESLETIKALTFLREVFQRVQSDSNYMIVLAGKFNFPDRMSEQFSPLNRFFPSQRLRRLGLEDVEDYVNKGLKGSEIFLDDSAVKKIKKKSEGHPYVLVCICFILFDSLNPDEKILDKNVINRCESKIRSRLSQDFFNSMFHPLSPKAKKIICTLAKKLKGLEFSSAEASKITKINNNQLSPYFIDFTQKGILTKPSRGTYWIFHTLFKEYLIHNSKIGKFNALTII